MRNYFYKKRVFEDQVAFPLDLEKIGELQGDDDYLKRMVTLGRNDKRFQKENRQGYTLWTYNDKIFVPKKARAPMVEWYHEDLRHTGTKRTASTLRQYFDWPGAVEQIKQYIKKYPKYQMTSN